MTATSETWGVSMMPTSRLPAALIVLGTALCNLHSTLALQLTSRRRLMNHSAFIAAVWCSPDKAPANAAKGAAEYDFEYYVRDLIGGNVKEGTMAASKAPPAPAPRSLTGPLIPLLLNDDCSPSCIPTQALLERMKVSDFDVITSKMRQCRSRASRSFAARASWNEEHITDQYYFDLTCYSLWRTAADLLPDYAQRDVFARNVGRGILTQMVNQDLLRVDLPPSKGSALTSTVAAVTEVLRLYQDSGFCKSFQIGEKDMGESLFDELDDDDIKSGASVNCLVSVYEPATLGASLQITGEQSRFIPEYVGATLAALWEATGLKVSYETYFVDPEYRPNPKDYVPNEQLLQFTLTRKSA